MNNALSILYRGPLSSCNYDCSYCPFAKRRESPAELAADRAALERFTTRIAELDDIQWSVFFTPWGEALVRRWYRDAIASLSLLPHLGRVALQTNLSIPPRWLDDANHEKVGVWATYHPAEVDLDRFLTNALAYRDAGVSLSVGVVGMKEHFAAIAALRERLPSDVYLWINAYKRTADYYASADADFLTQIDPFFPTNNTRHPSRGRPCATGQEVFSVDGAGVMRRCHFVADPIGDFYSHAWRNALRPRPCPNQSCGCHIGYVHLRDLRLHDIYGEGLLERVPLVLSDSKRALSVSDGSFRFLPPVADAQGSPNSDGSAI